MSTTFSNPRTPAIFVVIAVISAFAFGGCHAMKPPTEPVNPPATAQIAAPSITPEKDPPHVDMAPRLGKITIGAFAPEAMAESSLSLPSLDDDDSYGAYRTAVRDTYGADLADMNYLGVGTPGWQARYAAFKDWLLRAGKYGDPTIAIEPIGKSTYAAFRDDDEMRALKAAFDAARQAGIVVWVRFASESNLRYSVYSVYNNPRAQQAYRRAERWFRGYMPPNVRLVFSPLINTAYLRSPSQIKTLLAMYEPGAYDRIGGTLYATSWLRPKIAFDWYYHFMRRLDTSTPFQICELGGTYPRSREVEAFLIRVARGDWPGVERVNLFAGDLNSIAIANHGHFGFVLPGETTSYVSELFDGNAASTRYAQLAGDRRLALLEAIGSGWKSGNMTLSGQIVRIYHGQARLDIRVSSLTDEAGDVVDLTPARVKHVLITPDCSGAGALERASPGETIQVTGWDDGAGTPLRAVQIGPPDS